MPRSVLLALLAAPATLLPAQDDPAAGAARQLEGPAQPGTLTPATDILPKLVPLHGAPVGQGDGGLWAAGPDYKASFHDGFAFYPYVPGQQSSRALQWHTEALRVGEQELLLQAPAIVHSDTRCEFRRPGLLESYDIQDNGIEQKFVVEQRPATPGAITIVARIDTAFAAPAQAAKAGALRFATPEGQDALDYGAATVVDHAGRRADVATSFDGHRIELLVDADFVAAAEFPIVVDPLTAAVTYGTFSMPITATAIAAGSIAGNHRVLSCLVREFSATDHDVSAYLLSDTQSGPGTLVYVNNSTVDMDQIDAGEVDGTQSWVLAVRSNTSTSTVFLYQHQQASSSLNSGTVIALPTPQASQIDARVGGAHVAGTRAVVVWREVTLATFLEGAVLDTQTHAITPFHIGPSFVATIAGGLAVSKSASSVEPWRVLWTNIQANLSFMTVAVVDQAGSVSLATQVGAAIPSTDYMRDLRLAGSAGRYLATYVTQPTGTNGQLHTMRFDFSQSGTLANVHERVLDTATSPPLQTLTNGDLAFDLVTMSHWAVTWRSTQVLFPLATASYANIVRLGYTGGVTESASLHAVSNEGAAHPSVAFDGYPMVGSAEGFVVNYSTAVASHPVFFRRFTYTPPTGAFYGTSCRNNTMGDGHPPYAGSEFYYTFVANLAPGTPALAVIGFSPANVPLGGFGLTGCTLLVNQAGTLSSIADAAGYARITLPLPDDPLFNGNVYLQWAWIEPGANPVGVVLGGGLQFHVQ